MISSTRVYLEAGERRVFAVAIEWPGWARAHRSEEAALGALATYGHRYGPVARLAGLKFIPDPGFEIVERVKGGANTDFGVPHEPWSGDDGAHVGSRDLDLLTAAWTYLDSVVAAAPAELRKGPRGGGRDRDAIATHVIEAEGAYTSRIGLKGARPPRFDDAAGVAAWRGMLREALLSPEPARWPRTYALRRLAWHILDHAWEIEDRS